MTEKANPFSYFWLSVGQMTNSGWSERRCFLQVQFTVQPKAEPCSWEAGAFWLLIRRSACTCSSNASTRYQTKAYIFAVATWLVTWSWFWWECIRDLPVWKFRKPVSFLPVPIVASTQPLTPTGCPVVTPQIFPIAFPYLLLVSTSSSHMG